jgi:hypothetical protein
MIRRLLLMCFAALAALLLVAPAAAASTAPTASTVPAAPSTTERLPGTSLEAEERDDGGTSAAPWVIGSGVAALAVVVLGGLFLKRRGG